jgi:Gpi18-like mannosyltransferase
MKLNKFKFKFNIDTVTYIGIFLFILFYKISLFQNLEDGAMQEVFKNITDNGFASLGFSNGNLSPIANTLVWFVSIFTSNSAFGFKIVSLIADLVLAYGVYLITNLYRPNLKHIAFLVSFGLPGLTFAGSVAGKLDVLLACAITYCVYFLLTNKINYAFILWGVALAMQIEGLILAPVFLYLCIKGYINSKNTDSTSWFFFVPGIFSVGLATLFGRPAIDSVIKLTGYPEGFLSNYIFMNSKKELNPNNMPGIFSWVNSSLYNILYPSVYIYSLAIIIFFVWGLTKFKFKKDLLLEVIFIISTFTLLMIPKNREVAYVIPQLLAVLLAFKNPKYIWFSLIIYIPIMVSQFRLSIFEVTGPIAFGLKSGWATLLAFGVLTIMYWEYITHIEDKI